MSRLQRFLITLTLALGLALGGVSLATADDDPGQQIKEGTEKAWDKTKDGSKEAWDKTKEGSKKAWDKTKEGMGKGMEQAGDGMAKTGENMQE